MVLEEPGSKMLKSSSPNMNIVAMLLNPKIVGNTWQQTFQKAQQTHSQHCSILL